MNYVIFSRVLRSFLFERFFIYWGFGRLARIYLLSFSCGVFVVPVCTRVVICPIDAGSVASMYLGTREGVDCGASGYFRRWILLKLELLGL